MAWNVRCSSGVRLTSTSRTPFSSAASLIWVKRGRRGINTNHDAEIEKQEAAIRLTREQRFYLLIEPIGRTQAREGRTPWAAESAPPYRGITGKCLWRRAYSNRRLVYDAGHLAAAPNGHDRCWGSGEYCFGRTP